MTNLLILTIVVSHSCTTPAHIQQNIAGKSTSSDAVSVSAQPVSPPYGAAPSPKPAAQTGLTTPSKDASSDELTYKAHLVSARAFVKAKEEAKAIESYEKAILAAPNKKSREAVIEELNSFSAKHWWGWFLDSFKLFLQAIKSFFIWIIIGLLLLCLRRLWRMFKGKCLGRKLHSVLIVPTSGSEFSTYFCDLIRYAHDSFEEQRTLVTQIGNWSSATSAPTFQSAKLLAESHYNLSNVLPSKWWAPLVNPVFNKIDPPNYIVHLGVSNAENRYGLTIRLCSRGQFLNHWHQSCANVDVHRILEDLAYQIVANINQHE